MAGEAEIILGQTQLTESVSAGAAQVANDAIGVNARYDAYAALKADVEKLYSAAKAQADDAAFRDFKLAYDDFWGYDDMIGRDEYHKLAKGYNNLISGFPGGVVATLPGQGGLNTFGG